MFSAYYGIYIHFGLVLFIVIYVDIIIISSLCTIFLPLIGQKYQTDPVFIINIVYSFVKVWCTVLRQLRSEDIAVLLQYLLFAFFIVYCLLFLSTVQYYSSTFCLTTVRVERILQQSFLFCR